MTTPTRHAPVTRDVTRDVTRPKVMMEDAMEEARMDSLTAGRAFDAGAAA